MEVVLARVRLRIIGKNKDFFLISFFFKFFFCYDLLKKYFFSDSDNIPNDSGLASSVDESIEENSKKVDKKSKKGLKKGSKDKKFEENSTVGQIHQADLIFNLDF